ncbi:MAG: hypothetical protein IJH12_03090 [Clostridia bacterium]|nr:hypothetical protein [Clostridia bacterium]
MDEFVVIKVMNEAMLKLKKSKNENCTQNEKIKEYLEDKDFFYKVSKDSSIKVLMSVGVAEDKLEETYQKLVKRTAYNRDEYVKKFYNEVCKNLGENYKIILEPGRALKEDWIEYDTVKWEIEKPVDDIVNQLLEDKTLSLEEKIIKVYQFICITYIYDANVLYFFKRDDSDPLNIKYIAVDWYGRVVGPEWAEKRKNHNRRICYEFSRFYAKAINKLIDGKADLEAFMLGDKENTHYVVGLTGKDYSVILDQDDFNSIKDLTRLKMGLTIKGIHILRDEHGKFSKAVNDYNKNRLDELPEIKEAEQKLKQTDVIGYFNVVINAINKFNIDSQGFFECLRHIIEDSGFKIEKIWKEDTSNIERRYERCLYFEYKGQTYLLDSIDKTLTVTDIANLDNNVFVTNAGENQYEYFGG